MIRCSECGGTNVQYVEWIRPNVDEGSGEIVRDGEPFLDYKALYYTGADMGFTWCEYCQENTPLEDEDERTDRPTAGDHPLPG